MTAHPHASAGTAFHAAIEQRHVPGQDAGDDADGFAAGESVEAHARLIEADIERLAAESSSPSLPRNGYIGTCRLLRAARPKGACRSPPRSDAATRRRETRRGRRVAAVCVPGRRAGARTMRRWRAPSAAEVTTRSTSGVPSGTVATVAALDGSWIVDPCGRTTRRRGGCHTTSPWPDSPARSGHPGGRGDPASPQPGPLTPSRGMRWLPSAIAIFLVSM